MVAAVLAACVPVGLAEAQVRGVYPLGMSATGAGVTPEPGLSYVNSFIFYSRDEAKGSEGEVLATGQNSVLMDMNTFVWVTGKKIGSATFSMAATFPIANNSLSSDELGALSGGGGFADSYYQPLILGWKGKRLEARVIGGFLAPTGRFRADASDNVGCGYWTWAASSGQTLYLDESRRTTVSAFQMYEVHTTQEGTGIHPGQNFNLDYSLTRMLHLVRETSIQVGLVGYGQWQTTGRTGPTLISAQTAERYRVNALGFVSNVLLPARRVSLGLKYFHEFASRSTFQGYSLQITGAVAF
jgi:hypothetical protein